MRENKRKERDTGEATIVKVKCPFCIPLRTSTAGRNEKNGRKTKGKESAGRW